MEVQSNQEALPGFTIEELVLAIGQQASNIAEQPDLFGGNEW